MYSKLFLESNYYLDIHLLRFLHTVTDTFHAQKDFPSIIANCWNAADIHALDWVAGIATNFSGGSIVCCVNFGKVIKDSVIHGELDGICAGGNPAVWNCRPTEGDDFDFEQMTPLLKEAEAKFDLGGISLIPWSR